LPYQLREALEQFADLSSLLLEAKYNTQIFEAWLRRLRLHEDLVIHMSHEKELGDGLIRYRPNLLDFVPAIGIGLCFGGTFTAFGRTPSAEQGLALADWLSRTVSDGVYHTDRLPLLYPEAVAFADVAAGVLAISVSLNKREDYVLWFRPELIQAVIWAGDPHRGKDRDQETGILRPRESFKAWKENVRWHAEPWLETEIDAAKRLRVSLQAVVRKRDDHSNQDPPPDAATG
jgi:light-regulated signal transduction histidine kinase (bacteriophytochrome)